MVEKLFLRNRSVARLEGGVIRSQGYLLGFSSASDSMQKKPYSYYRIKKYMLKVINFTHPAHFKELQIDFEIYLLLVTFPKK